MPCTEIAAFMLLIIVLAAGNALIGLALLMHVPAGIAVIPPRKVLSDVVVFRRHSTV